MRAAGVSVTEAVREIVTHNRSMYDGVKMGIVNYTALAERIRPAVERHVGAPVNLNTIVVAIKRYADSFEQGGEPEGSALRDARLSLTDGVIDVHVSVREIGGDPFEMLDRFSAITDDYEFVRMADTFSIITEDAAAVRDFFGGVGGSSLSSGLAKIRIAVAREQSRPDIISHVAEILHADGIELVNAFFGGGGITLVLRERDASRAYELLREQASRGS